MRLLFALITASLALSSVVVLAIPAGNTADIANVPDASNTQLIPLSGSTPAQPQGVDNVLADLLAQLSALGVPSLQGLPASSGGSARRSRSRSDSAAGVQARQLTNANLDEIVDAVLQLLGLGGKPSLLPPGAPQVARQLNIDNVNKLLDATYQGVEPLLSGLAETLNPGPPAKPAGEGAGSYL